MRINHRDGFGVAILEHRKGQIDGFELIRTENLEVKSKTFHHERSEIYRSPAWSARRRFPNVYVPPTNYEHMGETFNDWDGYVLLPRYSTDCEFCYGKVGFALSHGITDRELPEMGDVRDLALINALTKLKDQDVNLAQAFGEREQTADLVLSTAKTLSKSVVQLRRGNIRGAIKELTGKEARSNVKNIPKPRAKDVPKRWLEIQYGWLPLLSDVDGAAKALAEKDEDSTRYRISVTGRYGRKDERFVSFTGNANYLETRRTDVRSFVRLDYLPKSEVLAQLSSLGLTNPASVAWELLPFSFIVDWFTPIGDWLNVLDAALPFDFLGGFATDTQELFVSSNAGNKPPVYASAKASLYKYASRRQSFGSSPLPTWPGMVPKVGATKTSIALSLLAANFSK